MNTRISFNGLCDDARHIACADNLNLNYVFAQARARLKLCALNFFLWRHFVKSSDLLFKNKLSEISDRSFVKSLLI